MRILHLADPHWDFAPKPTEARINGLIAAGGFDAVACSGDIANTARDVARFLSWFEDVDLPRFFAPGNHDLWAFKDPAALRDQAVLYGWSTLDPGVDYDVVDGVLLLNLFYTPQPAWDAWGGNDPHYTNDHHHFDVAARTRPEVKIPAHPGKVKWSLGHMSPSPDVPSKNRPHSMYVNPVHMELIRAHDSPVHLFGHTHEPVDANVGGVRCVNSAFVDRNYKIRADAAVIVHL